MNSKKDPAQEHLAQRVEMPFTVKQLLEQPCTQWPAHKDMVEKPRENTLLETLCTETFW